MGVLSSQAQRIFKSYPSIVHVDVPAKDHFTVCGDIHGQYYDLLHIFELNGLPSESNPYLFNGEGTVVVTAEDCCL